MDTNCVDLSVVIAAYNEATVIDANIGRVIRELDKRPNVRWELIVVNDGSQDQTGELINVWAKRDTRLRALHHRRNFGQGRALRTAFSVVKGDVIVTLDADLSYAPEYIFRLVESLVDSDTDIALASAYMKGGSVRNVPLSRAFMSRLANLYLAKLSHYDIATSTCVVRAYRRECIDLLVLTSDGMELQLEILMKAYMLGFRVSEIPADLVWLNTKATRANSASPRVSKMRISRSMRLYLLMGWLFKPASFFIGLALVLIVLGCHMAVILLYMIANSVLSHMSEGFIVALSVGLREVFTGFTYSFVFCGAFLLIGIQLLAFSLLLMQNKFYFDELYKLGHMQLWHRQRGGDAGQST
ncbi:MAG: hypothetical protein BWK76_13265 [Desulfobulbaceae bacterium A2]|nr:MAG: hypothetical protein BWK76_13265 [Desulfobulbaceae bacterium A2]